MTFLMKKRHFISSNVKVTSKDYLCFIERKILYTLDTNVNNIQGGEQKRKEKGKFGENSKHKTF